MEIKIKDLSPNHRNLKRVYCVVCLEGVGVEVDPARIVQYIYDENMKFIGKIDPTLST